MSKRWTHVVLWMVTTATAFAGEAVVLDADVGAPSESTIFGFGWWRPEQNPERNFRWIRFHMEAECRFALGQPPVAPAIEILAAPYYHPRRVQRLALYINDRFVAEWAFPHRPGWTFQSLRAAIPPECLRRGENRLILRVGYTGERGYAVAVDRIRILHGAVPQAATAPRRSEPPAHAKL